LIGNAVPVRLADDPVNTPRGLNTDNPMVGRALADAVTDLAGANIPLDGTLRDYQYETRAGRPIPIHGGPGTLGVFNAINVTWDPEAGYPNVAHGSSFIAAMTWAKRGCPVRQLSFVTYSESENQSSPHAADYTKAFSEKRWNEVPFCRRDVRDFVRSVSTIGTEIGLAQQDDRLGATLPNRGDVPLEPARIEIGIQRHDNECDINVRDQDLFRSAPTGDLARDLCSPRQNFMD